jgi:hypothetical protein
MSFSCFDEKYELNLGRKTCMENEKFFFLDITWKTWKEMGIL